MKITSIATNANEAAMLAAYENSGLQLQEGDNLLHLESADGSNDAFVIESLLAEAGARFTLIYTMDSPQPEERLFATFGDMLAFATTLWS